MISQVREKLVKFYQNVKKEEALQVLYSQVVPDSPPYDSEMADESDKESVNVFLPVKAI